MDEGGSPPGSPMSSRLAGVDRATATALKKAEAAAKVSQMAASQMSASQLAVAAALPRAAGTAVPQPTASRSNTVEVEEMEVDVGQGAGKHCTHTHTHTHTHIPPSCPRSLGTSWVLFQSQL